MIKQILTATFLLFTLLLSGQEEKSMFLQRLEDFKIQPVLGVQLWASYTENAQIWDEEKSNYIEADDRLNFQIRRIRFGWKAQPYKNLSMRVVGAYDLIGRDILAGPTGGQNNGGFPAAGLWEAYTQWRLIDNSENIYLTTGYFVPQFGRESFTSAFAVTSISKMWSQNYIRRHLVGRGPGRTVGMNLGGLLKTDKGDISLKYNLGIHNPRFNAAGGNSIGVKASPLAVARVALSIGDPEESKYSLGGKINYLGKRRGVSLGFGATQQGETDLFVSNTAIGLDLLFNWDNFQLDAERIWMQREGVQTDGITIFMNRSETFHVRTSYNFEVGEKYILEPVAAVRFFEGADAIGRDNALLVSSDFGEDRVYKVGLNCYITASKLKLSLGYVWRNGEAPDDSQLFSANQLYLRSNGESIRRGNWIGLGLVFVL